MARISRLQVSDTVAGPGDRSPTSPACRKALVTGRRHAARSGAAPRSPPASTYRTHRTLGRHPSHLGALSQFDGARRKVQADTEPPNERTHAEEASKRASAKAVYCRRL